MRRVLLIVLSATILLVSCKKGTVENPTEQAYVMFAPAFTLDVETKTGILNPIGELRINAQVIGSRGNSKRNDFTTIYTIGSESNSVSLDQPVTFSNTGGAFPEDILYPIEKTEDDLINLKAYAPADTEDDAVAKVTRDGNIVTFTGLDGDIDVMMTQLQGTDGTYAEPATGQGSSAEDKRKVKLIFEHGLSRVSFKIAKLDSPSDADAANAAWGDITKIELVDHPNSVKLNLADNTVETPTTIKGAIVVHEDEDGWAISHTADVTLNSDNNSRGAMIPAHTELSIKIYSENFLEGRTVTFNKTTVKNTHHIYTLKLDGNKGVHMSVGLEDWKDWETGTVPPP